MSHPKRVKSEADINRTAAFRWGALIVLLLASQIAIGVAAIVLAGSDPSVAVVPGYHKKAILWDESMAMREHSRELGWNVTLRVLPGLRTSRVNWTVCDRDGSELKNLRGRVLMFHHARANEAIEFRIEDHPDGMEVDRFGLWQVEMTLEATESGTSQPFFDSKLIDIKRAH